MSLFQSNPLMLLNLCGTCQALMFGYIQEAMGYLDVKWSSLVSDNKGEHHRDRGVSSTGNGLSSRLA